ncbi:MAG: amidohydrolase family protein [Hyphomicrobiaceae bacterium]
MVSQATNQIWLDQVFEPPLEPELKICDPHHHLWDHREGTVQPRYLLDELLADLNCGHNVVSTVFVECGTMFKADGPDPLRPIGETEFANGVAAMSASNLYGHGQLAAAIIGTVDLKIGDAAADVLDAQIAAGGGRFRGVRLGALWHPHPSIRNHRTNPPEELLRRDDFRSGFRHLARRGLSFDVWCCHPQIPDATDLARAFPDTTLIVDHCGGPLGIGPYAGKSDEVFKNWKQKIDELARCSNVMMKLGGLNMDINGYGWDQRKRPPTSRELMQATRRYFETAIQAFGVERCMFESNFPVDKISCSYTVLWNSFKKITAGFSDDEKAALFHDTAARVYRI